MIVDTSAVVAILEDEDDAERYRTALAESLRTRVSAATLVEMGVVVDVLGDPVLSRRLDEVLLVAAVVVEPLLHEGDDFAATDLRSALVP